MTFWRVVLTQLFFPQEDGQVWEFYFEDRPTKEDVLAAINRKIEQNKDLPEYAEYHSFMYSNVQRVEWFDSDCGGHKTDELYVDFRQITTEPKN